ncbi:helix-turn-helix domain-containing protein [Streptomyces cyaneofuscatus]|uniref:helix-turn-helix domain-containing protein n=1 Tax=Streptomyces cyaneofuscatus TaxID=66883 RepID=UPI0037BD2362
MNPRQVAARARASARERDARDLDLPLLRQPRWVPRTEDDLQAAIDGGLFEENHHLDLKKAPDTKRDNRELARDLASFAIDGGTLIIGVQENKDSRTFELSPSRSTGSRRRSSRSPARSSPDPRAGN